MQDFIEKWKTDSTFKTKIKLGLYTLFIVATLLFALSNNNSQSEKINNEDKINIENNSPKIIIPASYRYTTNIKINNTNYIYNGTKEINRESITKITNESIINYIYENNSYYKEEDEKYVLITKEEVYGEINPTYLKPETINQYLLKSKKQDDDYIVYLKDLILGDESGEYITINIDENNLKINYTSMMQEFNPQINSYIVEIKIEEME